MRTRRWGYIKGMIAGRIERLEEMIAVHEEIAGEEAIELADAASFDPGPEAERLRRFQAAKSRELRQTLELFLKMQAAKTEDLHHRGHGGRGRNTGSGCERSQFREGERKTLTTEGTENTEGRERRDQECANEANSGSRTGSGGAGQGTVEEDGADSTTGGTEGGGPRDEAGGGRGRAGSPGGPAQGGRFPAGSDPGAGSGGRRRRGVEGKKRRRAKPSSR